MFRKLRWRWRAARGGKSAEGPAGELVLRLERELQESRLELAERDRSIERLRAELARVRGTAEEDAGQRARADVEQIVETIGVPLTQFATQAYLYRTGETEVRAGDVVEVGARLVRSLREVGVETVGEVGAMESFDPERHDPLSMTVLPVAGRVVVRLVGLSYHGRVVRKAGVDPVTDHVDAGEQ